MCGIAGLITRAGAPDPSYLSLMASRLSHRGPDDQGIVCRENVGLIHTRLSIIDLSGGHQPIETSDGALAVIANGEIYNFIELRAELERAGYLFSTHSDTETLLHAYHCYGSNFLDHVHGMFAFAIHDRTRGELILGRDRLGIKPLFIHASSSQIAFASEIKALLPAIHNTPAINPGSLIQFLQSRFTTGAETIFDGIHRINPGELCVIDTSTLNISRHTYWSPLHITQRKRSFEEAAEEFEPLFRQVMTEHMRSDVPYGLFLSGGNDSAILASWLRRLDDRPLHSFSVGYTDSNGSDELPDAERIAKLCGTTHRSIKLSSQDIIPRIVHTTWLADDLMRDFAMLPTAILAEEAARELKVVFTGEGADEVFCGYGRYRRTRLQRFLKNLIAPGSGGFRTRGNWDSTWSKRIFGDDLSKEKSAFRRPYIDAWRTAPRSWSDIQKSQYTDVVTALPDNLLVKVDRMLMGYGLEGRVPFLDHRIVEFGMSLPDDLRVQGRTPKLFLRRWAEQYLPKDHLYKRKRAFTVPIRSYLSGQFLDRLERRLASSKTLANWFDLSQLKGLFAAHRAGADLSIEIWTLMQFAIWHTLFVDSPNSVPTTHEDPVEWIS